ncbi:MAG: branched-chain amino acid ABC transporter permease [Treponemataceae bacterium]
MNSLNKKQNKNQILYIAIAILIFSAVMGILNITIDSYVRRILNLCFIYVVIGLSMNLVNGFTGLFSLGQAGFMAIGAYSVAIFTLPISRRVSVFYIEPMLPTLVGIELPFVIALLIGGVVAAVVAFLVGAPCLKLKGDYLAIATLGFSEIIRIIFTNLQPITNGSLGIQGIPSIRSLWWTYGTALFTLLFISLLINSSHGRAFKAIREDDIAAEAMGINLFNHKVLSFMIGAFFAAIGGGLLASLLGTVDPRQFYFTLTYNILLIIVLGGMGSISGTVISAFIVTTGQEWLRFLDEPLVLFGSNIPFFKPGFRMVVYSILLMVIVLFYNKGLMGQTEITFKQITQWLINLKKKLRKGGFNE